MQYPRFAVIVLCISLMATVPLMAQNGTSGNPASTYVTLSAKHVFARDDGEGAFAGNNEFRWKFSFNNGAYSSCIQRTGGTGWYYDVNQYIVGSLRVANVNGDYSIGVQGWEDDCGDACSSDGSCGFLGAENDDVRCDDRGPSINPYEYSPGLVHEVTKAYCDGRYQATYNFSYRTPTPDRPAVYVNGAPYSAGNRYCENVRLRLATNTFLRTSDQQNVTLYWYYNVNGKTVTVAKDNPASCWGSPMCEGAGGIEQQRSGAGVKPLLIPPDGEVQPCCFEEPIIYEDEPLWQLLGTTNAGASGSSTEFDLLSIPDLADLSVNTYLTFKVVAVSNGSTSLESPLSTSFEIAPQPPTFTTEGVSVEKSCRNESNGSITITDIAGKTNSYRYLVTRAGETAGVSSSFSGSTVTINGLAAGTYSVALTNNGGATTPCPFTIGDIVVGMHPDPVLNTPMAYDVSCPGGTDGRIEVSATGGKPGIDMTFSLTPAAGNFVRQSATAGYFEQVPPGVYTVNVTDQLSDTRLCGNAHEYPNVQVKDQPAMSLVSFAETQPFCSEPFNGAVTIRVAGGSGSYHYRVYSGSTEVRSSLANASATFTISDLPPGTYYMDVRDAARESCDGVTTREITLREPATLQMTQTHTNIECFGASTGSITLQATGGSGSYIYSLVNVETGQERTGTDGLFGVLPRGTYRPSVMNADGGCNNTLELADIEIKQPNEIDIGITQKNITCAGDDNGALSAVVTEGQGSFSYQWRFNDGTGWTDYAMQGGRTPAIAGLFPADYLLQVNDIGGCPKYSDTLHLPEPARLVIDDMLVRNVTCAGADDGTITITPSGGWQPYSYYYATAGSSDFTRALVPATKLAGATYAVRVADAEGCTVDGEATVDGSTKTFDVNFLSSSSLYTGDTLYLSEISFPKPDSVAWGFPEGYTLYSVNADEPQITFLEPGEYVITLTGYHGDCTDVMQKTISFETPDPFADPSGRPALGASGIKGIAVYPNPTEGMVKVVVDLYRAAPVALFVYNFQGQEIHRMLMEGENNVDFKFDLSRYPNGIYVARVVTGEDKREIRIVVGK